MDKVYLPFWIVLEFLDQTPPDAFIPCFVRNSVTHDGTTFHELALYKPHSELVAYNIPAEYVIQPEDLMAWGLKIASWFTESAREQTDAVSDNAYPVSCPPYMEANDHGEAQEEGKAEEEGKDSQER